MGYKDDIKLKENFDRAKTGEFGGFNYYLKKLKQLFYEEQLYIKNIDEAVGLVAQNAYIREIIEKRGNIANAYSDVVAPQILTSDENIEKKAKLINAMNSIIDLVNLVHDKSNPISMSETSNVMIEQSIPGNVPKRLHKRDGIVYNLDDEEYLFLENYKDKNETILKCGNIAIMVSPDLIDIQFDEKEGIIISKDSEDCKYYKLPENKEKLLETRNYNLNPEWYEDDLTDSVISYNNVSQILLSCITSIEDEIKRENVLQDFNYLLAKARLTTITHIPDKRDQKIEKINEIKESFTKYHEKKEAEIAQLMQENNDLKKKSDDLKVDDMKKEIETLKSQNAVLSEENSSLQETIEVERSAWGGIPIIGKFISRRIESRKNKALPQGDEPIINLPNTLEDIKHEEIDYSQAEVEKTDKDIEQRIK